MPTDLKARIKAGALREKMSLYKPIDNRTATGTTNQTYQLVDDEVWAEVVPLFGGALYFATQMQPLQNSTVTIRYRDDIAASWMLVTEDGNFSYTIQGVPCDINHRHTLLRLNTQAQQVGEGRVGRQY